MSQIADLLQDPSLSVPLQPKEQNVIVIVNGSRFCLVPSLYQKIHKMPWREVGGFLHLNAHPDIFEILLQFFLFGTLPEVSGLADHEANELKKLAAPLKSAKTLIDHVEAGSTKISETCESSSFLKRKLSSFTPGKSRKKQQKDENWVPQETVSPFAASKTNSAVDVDYLPNLESSTSTESEASSIRISASVDHSTLTCDSIASKSSNGDSTSSQKRHQFFRNVVNTKRTKSSRKMTHEEWCRSEYVV